MSCASTRPVRYSRSVDGELDTGFWVALLGAVMLFALGVGVGAVYSSFLDQTHAATTTVTVTRPITITVERPRTTTVPPPPILPAQ
jgi:hypothetical protein